MSGTRIFARFVKPGHQTIVYQMRLDAPEDLAMILPIPVAQPAAEDVVRFVNLEDYQSLFDDLEMGFPNPRAYSAGLETDSLALDNEVLEVHSVGSYDASLVPNVKSFSRLDERFRLPDGVWDELPQYATFGFAVFKLKKGEAKVHPMAFTFPTATPEALFFPTVHIHDGKVHPKEKFDHLLYGQAGENATLSGWTESPGLARNFVKIDKTEGLVADSGHVYRKSIDGLQKNVDITVGVKRLG